MKNGSIDISIILYIKLFENEKRRSYILDSGMQGETKDRISIYMEGNFLVFSVTDRTSVEYKTNFSALGLLNNFHSLIFEIINQPNKSVMSIFVGNELVSFSDIASPLIFTNNPLEENYFVGADRMGRNPCDFEISEQLVYEKTLSAQEKYQINNYLQQKHGPNPRARTVFTKGAFIYHDTGYEGLIQPDLAKRPRYANTLIDE
jgi:hypothetical protein